MTADCPGLELLAAFVDGKLTERTYASEQIAALEAHFASCESCRAKVALAVELENSDDSAEYPQKPSEAAIGKNTVQFQPANYL
jgi:hypothetical protein